MKVSVIIPTWNGRDNLLNLLDDLSGQTLQPAETIIVDNGSTDGSEVLATIRLKNNQGFSYAVNRGIKAARHEWIAILNNDVRLPGDWLQKILSAASDADAWFAAGKLLRTADPGQIDGTFDLLCRGACAWRAGHCRPDGPEWSTGRKVFSVPFTAAVFRRSLFRRVGLLDEEFESYLEDVDFGLRCALAGLEGLYVPEAVASHIGSATLGVWNAGTVRRVSRNQLLLVAKHYPPDWLRRFGWHVLVAQLLWGAVALRHGAGWPWLLGKGEAIRKLRATPRRDKPGIEAVLRASEGEIRRLQAQSGYDLFWRLYFAVTWA